MGETVESGGNGQQTEAGRAYGRRGLTVWADVEGPWTQPATGGR